MILGSVYWNEAGNMTWENNLEIILNTGGNNEKEETRTTC